MPTKSKDIRMGNYLDTEGPQKLDHPQKVYTNNMFTKDVKNLDYIDNRRNSLLACVERTISGRTKKGEKRNK